jgi:hypothetical protein
MKKIKIVFMLLLLAGCPAIAREYHTNSVLGSPKVLDEFEQLQQRDFTGVAPAQIKAEYEALVGVTIGRAAARRKLLATKYDLVKAPGDPELNAPKYDTESQKTRIEAKERKAKLIRRWERKTAEGEAEEFVGGSQLESLKKAYESDPSAQNFQAYLQALKNYNQRRTAFDP